MQPSVLALSLLRQEIEAVQLEDMLEIACQIQKHLKVNTTETNKNHHWAAVDSIGSLFQGFGLKWNLCEMTLCQIQIRQQKWRVVCIFLGLLLSKTFFYLLWLCNQMSCALSAQLHTSLNACHHDGISNNTSVSSLTEFFTVLCTFVPYWKLFTFHCLYLFYD